MKSVHALLFIVLVICNSKLCCAVPTDPVLPSEGLIFFDENPFNGSERGFYSFDASTQELHLVSTVDYPSDRFSGFSWSIANQVVYAGSEEGRLYSFDLFTGDATPIGQVLSGSFIRGIAIHPMTGDLYGMGFGPRIYRINPEDASSELLGIANHLDGGLEFLPDGTLLGWSDSREVMEVSTVNAATQAITAGTVPQISNWTYAPDGFLYGAGWGSGSIERIDPNTGETTRIAAFAEHSNGLIGAFYYSSIPEPNALALAIVSLCLVGMRHR